MLQPFEFLQNYIDGSKGFTTHWQPDWEIHVRELKSLLDAGSHIQLIDVRQPFEYNYCRLSNSRLLPLDELPYRLNELNPSLPTVVYCHHGRRSLDATRILRYAGFADVRSLAGGTEAWADQIDPTMPRY